MLLVVNVEYYILFTIIHTVRRKTAHVLLPWQRRESSQECRQRSVEGNMADVWVMTSSCLLALLLRHSAWHRHSQCSSLRYGEVEKKSSSGLCIFVFFLSTIKQNKTKKNLKNHIQSVDVCSYVAFLSTDTWRNKVVCFWESRFKLPFPKSAIWSSCVGRCAAMCHMSHESDCRLQYFDQRANDALAVRAYISTWALFQLDTVLHRSTSTAVFIGLLPMSYFCWALRFFFLLY